MTNLDCKTAITDIEIIDAQSMMNYAPDEVL